MVVCVFCYVHSFLLRLCWWQHDDVLPLTASKFEYVLVPQLKVATRLEILSVELCAITAFQVNDVGLDLSLVALDTEFVFNRLLYVPKLDDCVLST